jgi:DNA-directed RNA polymerase subunit RPC12/RpoP
MNLSCPKCSKQLPQVETLQYRFCPHCGAEIPAEPKRLDEAFHTIPPDLNARRSKKIPKGPSPAATGIVNVARPSIGQTIEPNRINERSRPKIQPPATPPPASFFRVSPEKKIPAPKDIQQQPAAHNRNRIIVAVLILLAVIIMVVGGFLTF